MKKIENKNENTFSIDNDLSWIPKVNSARIAIKEQLSKVIVGQETIIEELLIALLAKGNCIIVGVPGLAKTLLISSIAQILELDFKRIQFTPDLMPSDITGTEIIQEDKNTRERVYRFMPGPIFANIVLADEINRTPPKTQSALLQAMQEHQVTIGGKMYSLPNPFFVLATQNPVEQEGTYSLPEAQLDRFLFQININYPSKDEEKEIIHQTTSDKKTDLNKVLLGTEVVTLQSLVRRVPVSDILVDYAVRLVRATRPQDSSAFDFVKKWVRWGAGPRAAQAIVLGAKSRALLLGRTSVTLEDIKSVCSLCLRHRVILSFQAESEGVSSDSLIQKILDVIPQ